MLGLKNKRVLITGAASGIGRATAERFHKEGCKLLLVDMPDIESTELNHLFKKNMKYIQGDVTKKETLALLDDEMSHGIDVVINNAGITRDAQTVKMTDEQWDQVIAVNLTAVFKISQMAAKHLKAFGKGGSIINAASVVAHFGNFGQANYVATKAGVIGMTKTMAKELGKYQIRVNAVAPGFIATPIINTMPEKVVNMMQEKSPLNRIGEPHEIAAAYGFLASDEAKFITGTCLNVDGGIAI